MADEVQLSFDEMAAQAAATMRFDGSGPPLEKGGAAGDMPTGQTATEGGFTADAGGQVITAGVEGAVAKGGQTGPQMTSEPGAQNQNPKTGAQMTSEPGAQAGGGAGAGGNLPQTGDEATRRRKAGQVGVSGGSTGGGNLSESEDERIRGRKAGKVGMSKAEAIEMGLTKAQFEKMEAMGLVKADVEIEVGGDDENDKDKDKDEAEKAKTCKGGEVEATDLMKSLQTLEAIGAGAAIPTTEDRRVELAKGLEAGTLTQDEMVELADLMKAAAGEPDEEPMIKSQPVVQPEPEVQQEIPPEEALDPEQMGKSFQDQFADAETEHETYDISPYLERLHQQTAGALDQIQDNLQKALHTQGTNQRNYNVQLAKGLQGMVSLSQQQGALIKSLANRLQVVEETPMPRRGVTSLSQQQVLSKGFASEAGGQGPQLQRVQILDSLEQMAMRMDEAPCGERLDRAMAMYESGGQLTKSLYGDVVNFIRANQGNNGAGLH